VIKVHKSDVGQYVLIHGPTQTFIIDEDLAKGYERLEVHLRTHHPDFPNTALDAVDQPAASPKRDSRLPLLLLVAVLAALPFLWLVVLHHSLAALVTELRLGPEGGYTINRETYDTMRQELDALYLEQNRLRQSVYHLQQQVTVLLEAAHGEPEGVPDGEGAAEADTPEGAPDATTDAGA